MPSIVVAISAIRCRAAAGRSGVFKVVSRLGGNDTIHALLGVNIKRFRALPRCGCRGYRGSAGCAVCTNRSHLARFAFHEREDVAEHA